MNEIPFWSIFSLSLACSCKNVCLRWRRRIGERALYCSVRHKSAVIWHVLSQELLARTQRHTYHVCPKKRAFDLIAMSLLACSPISPVSRAKQTSDNACKYAKLNCRYTEREMIRERWKKTAEEKAAQEREGKGNETFSWLLFFFNNVKVIY